MLVSFLLGMDRSSPTDYLSQLVDPSDFKLSLRYRISDVIQLIDPSIFQLSLCYHMSDVI